jgi:nucleotide-binding universal stress UspA family protein
MYTSILVPIDIAAKDISESILSKALFHLKNSHCQLTLIAVANANADENGVDTVRSQLMEFAESHIAIHEGRIHLKVSQGLPSDQVLTVATELNADCIFMGSHRGGTSQLGRATLGSTAAKIASQAKCDVCIIKAG